MANIVRISVDDAKVLAALRDLAAKGVTIMQPRLMAIVKTLINRPSKIPMPRSLLAVGFEW